MGGLVEDDVAVQAQGHEHALPVKGEPGKEAVVGGGAAEFGHGAGGVGAAVVDDAANARRRGGGLHQPPDAFQPGAHVADDAVDGGLGLVVIQQRQRADGHPLPVEPAVQVFHDGGGGSQHLAGGVADFVEVFQGHAGGDERGAVGRDGAGRHHAGAGLEVGVGVLPDGGTAGAEEHPHLDDFAARFGDEGQGHRVGEVGYRLRIHHPDTAGRQRRTAAPQAGRRRQQTEGGRQAPRPPTGHAEPHQKRRHPQSEKRHA